MRCAEPHAQNVAFEPVALSLTGPWLGLVDQFFDSKERRLAHTLLVMAKFGEPDESERLNPEVSEETLAEMIGASLSSVNFFMNRFGE